MRRSLSFFSRVSFLLVVVYILSSCGGKYNDSKDSGSLRFQQYYLRGESLYLTHCSNCHQQDGSGLKRVYPPLNKSDFMDKNFEAVVCLMRKGIQNEIIVNGNTYNQRMPSNPALTDIEIAEIATYIYNTWDHSKGLIETKEVTKIMEACN